MKEFTICNIQIV